MTGLLRLQADDSKVLTRTASALSASHRVKPRLRFRCRLCGSLLARVGDVPEFGPLFVSSWEVDADGHGVVVDGKELLGREKRQWLENHYVTVNESGEPIDAPLREAVIALLALPADLAQDYPDLLMRCNKHGDHIADRVQVIKALRAAGMKRVDVSVDVDGRYDYTPTHSDHLPGERSTRRVTRRTGTQ